MASIQTGIELHDSFTSVMYGIIESVYAANYAMYDFQDTMNEAVDMSPYDQISNDIEEATHQQDNFNQEINDGISQADELLNTIKGAVGAYASIQTVKKVLDVSDELVQTTSRLDMMNDGLQSTDELMNMVYTAAQDARGSFGDMANVVARFGNNAGDAFSSSAEIVAFADLVQKQMTIAGASTTEASNAMLQLSQGLGSGVLRGDELNSIFEQAPNLIQNIADYLDVPIGTIREMASEGKLTADIVNAAIFSASDEINAKFERMPMTWGQVWQSFQNSATMAFRPVLQRINDIANSEAFQTLVDGAIEALVTLANIALEVFDFMASCGQFIADNWSVIEPVIDGIVTALGIYLGVLAAVKIAEGITAGVTEAMAIATDGAAIAQLGLNGAMAACPIFWIIILIFALIAALILLWDNCEGYRKFIADSLNMQAKALGEFYNDTIVPVGNNIIALQHKIIDSIVGTATTAINAYSDMAINIVENIDWIADKVRGMLDMYNSVASFWGAETIDVDAVLSTEGINNMRNASIDTINSIYESMKADYMKPLDLEDFNAGVDEFTQGMENFTFSGFFNDLKDEVTKKLEEYGIDDGYLDEYLDELSETIGNISTDTGNISAAMDVTKEELKYLRDIAEQEAVNRYTTAEVTINQTNNNTVSGDMDLDGVVSGLTDAVNEAVDTITEGVHE